MELLSLPNAKAADNYDSEGLQSLAGDAAIWSKEVTYLLLAALTVTKAAPSEPFLSSLVDTIVSPFHA